MFNHPLDSAQTSAGSVNPKLRAAAHFLSLRIENILVPA